MLFWPCHFLSPWHARWSKSREPISCSAMTAFFWGTASTSPWCRRSAPYLMDCLWSLLTGTAKQRARRQRCLVLWRRISRDPRPHLPRPLLRTPNPPSPSQRSCQPKTSYTDWTCKSNSQSRPHAGWRRRKEGEVLSNSQLKRCLTLFHNRLWMLAACNYLSGSSWIVLTLGVMAV